MKSIKEKVAEKLQEQGGISGADIAELASSETAETVEITPKTREPKPEIPVDPVLEAGGEDQPHDVLKEQHEIHEAEGNHPFTEDDLLDVEVDPVDKERFLDCLTDGRRFTKEYQLFNGRVTVKFRTRTSEETAALLGELTRQAKKMEDLTSVEYSSMLRHANLVFQVDEIDDVTMPPPEDPIKAKYNDETGKIDPPAWWKRLDFYSGMQEGKEQAVYNTLLSFEKLYWTMIRKAHDQNFWNPEDSTSD